MVALSDHQSKGFGLLEQEEMGDQGSACMSPTVREGELRLKPLQRERDGGRVRQERREPK